MNTSGTIKQINNLYETFEINDQARVSKSSGLNFICYFLKKLNITFKIAQIPSHVNLTRFCNCNKCSKIKIQFNDTKLCRTVLK